MLQKYQEVYMNFLEFLEAFFKLKVTRKLLVLIKKQGKSYKNLSRFIMQKMLRKTPKNHQEVMKINFGIFVKSFDAQEVQEARSSGANSKKKNHTKRKKSYTRPRPSSKRKTGWQEVQGSLDRPSWIRSKIQLSKHAKAHGKVVGTHTQEQRHVN